jgi:hypothetical protein
VNLLGDNIDTMKENTETLIDSSKEFGLTTDGLWSSAQLHRVNIVVNY